MTGETYGLTKQLCEFIVETKYEAVPKEVIHECKRTVLDLIGNAVAGYDSEIGRIAVGYARIMGGHPRSTIIGDGTRTSPVLATHVNTRNADALDFTDTFMTWCHLGAPAGLTALAICEDNGANGKHLLLSTALGIEMSARFTLGVGPGPVPRPDAPRFFGQKGGVPDTESAATVAAIKALNLDTQQAAYAFGVFGAMSDIHTRTVRWFELTDMPLLKYGDAGQASHIGAYSAYMAQLGLTAHPAMFDGEKPLWTLRGAQNFNQDLIVKGLGEKWYTLENTYKPWPSCRFDHHSITAFCNVVDKYGLKANEIEHIKVQTHPWPAHHANFRNQEPNTMISCEFNIPHALAMIALGVKRGPKWYAPETLADERVRSFRRKVDVTLNEEALYPEQWYVDNIVGKLPTKVTVRARGQDFEGSTDHALGDPRDPATTMSDEDLVAKLKDVTSHRGDGTSSWDRRMDQVADLVFNLDQVEDLRSTMDKISELVAKQH